MCELASQQAPGGRSTKENLATLGKNGEHGIRELFSLALLLPPTCIMPKLIQEDPALAEEAFKSRTEAVGKRIKHFISHCKVEEGLDFKRGGCYSLIFPPGTDIASEIHHASGAKFTLGRMCRSAGRSSFMTTTLTPRHGWSWRRCPYSFTHSSSGMSRGSRGA